MLVFFGSAGSTNEQVVESSHASMNVYARNYACNEDVQLRFTSHEANGSPAYLSGSHKRWLGGAEKHF